AQEAAAQEAAAQEAAAQEAAAQEAAAQEAAAQEAAAQEAAAQEAAAQEAAAQEAAAQEAAEQEAAEQEAAPSLTAAQKTVVKKVESERAKAAESADQAISDVGQQESSIRVDVEVLSELMNQVGELVLNRNRLIQLLANDQGEVAQVGRNIDHIVTSLQEYTLRLRMQPIGTLWNRMPRVVRDLGGSLGKRIRLDMSGQNTELDRYIIAALKDPLVHIIRNSCDHGIETPEERVKVGKPAVGVVKLDAFQESSRIIIEISDDGKGIDVSRVVKKAIEMGVVTQEKASQLTDKVALQLIFHPGLSTAEKVSKVSGRGVGMDVVKQEIAKTGGHVTIESEMGKGSTIRMSIPLTLAIIPALVIRVAEKNFAMPQMNVQELLAIREGDHAWEQYAGANFYRLRGRLLPVLYLADALLLSDERPKEFIVIVVHAGASSFGLAVDAVLGSEEIVVKPMGEHFKNLSIYAGCSITGDGSVVPILDGSGLLSHLKLLDESDHEEAGVSDDNNALAQDCEQILVVENAGERYALMMSVVERLEKITADRFEVSAGRVVLQYREEVIPFKRLSSLMKGQDKDKLLSDSKLRQGVNNCVILQDTSGHHFCLGVDVIHDVLEVPVDIKLDSGVGVFRGTAVIQGRVTEVFDSRVLIDSMRCDQGAKKMAKLLEKN
ncbi:MAG: chemotaxis protein CheA, partial [Zetaproteobacteria bacterium]|nr:chemotaxis protein CheA [Zetaproteobacteria bacterium]